MTTRLIILSAVVASQLQGNFDFGGSNEGCEGGEGDFQQQINHYGGDFENAITVGTIYKDLKDVYISLKSDKDVDIRLYNANGERIVHWPHGLLSGASYGSTVYNGVTIEYSGYNGDGTQAGLGKEYIKITGTLQNDFVMKAFGYVSGYAKVDYNWAGKENCTQNSSPDASGNGNFEEPIVKDDIVKIGDIPIGVNNLNITLTSPKDVDVQLYDADDGTKIVHWPDGILKGATKQSTVYKNMKIEWSGYNGDGTLAGLGHEYIKITGMTTRNLIMKAYGYEAGFAQVDYEWGGESNDINSNNLIGIDVSSNNGSINWNLVKDTEVKFVFIKATEGYPESTYELNNEKNAGIFDKNFAKNITDALNVGLMVAPYHFIRVDYNEKLSDAKAAAKYFVSKIHPYYISNKLLPPVIDVENPPASKENPYNKNQIGKWSKEEFTIWIKTFATEVENILGIKPILYMNQNFTDNEVESSLLNSYKLWIAKYMFNAENGTVINNLDDIHSYDNSFKPNKDYLFWQFSETGDDINGIYSNYVDKNIFKGSIDELKSLLVKSEKDVNNNTEPDFSSTFYSYAKDSNGNLLQGYWYRGMAPKKFYDYSLGHSSDLGKCKTTGVEALGNCTWYAKSRARELGGTVPYPSWGNAGTFGGNAKNVGFTVDKNPTVGSIAYAEAYSPNYNHQYGHVAVVEEVYSNGTIKISESSYAPCSSTWNFLYRTRVVDNNHFTGYIHVEK